MQSSFFINTRFRAIPGKKDVGDHWIGGAPPHSGAVCPVCRIPLLLLWDIDCRDPRFPRLKFGAIQRLPLYFCWNCVNDLTYRVVNSSELEIFKSDTIFTAGNGSRNLPNQFERTRLSLVPSSVEDLLFQLDGWDFTDDPRGHTLSESQSRRISEFLGHPANMALDIFHSQFGGRPSKMGWDSEVSLCPNPRCSWLGRLFKKRRMKFLAGILNDPKGGLPMVQHIKDLDEQSWNFFVSVEFQMCRSCGTVKAMNRSD